MGERLLEVKDLRTYFYTEDGVVPAVDGISFSLEKGKTLGIVGESGCGKSVTSLTVMRLVASPPGKIVSGEIIFEGKDLLKLTEKDMRKVRGNEISMIFQEPMTSLNPVFTIGDQICEAILLHQKVTKKQARLQAIELLKKVGIPSAERRIDDYPHQMSGGMRQRVMIAMALSCNSKLLIADEPTTALDVTIQAQILDLMKKVRNDFKASIMLITHDLGVVADLADDVIVMYAGKIAEKAAVRHIYKNPKHPYTQGLLGSIPKLNETKERLHVIEGTVPNPFCMPEGCRFNPRCRYAKDICIVKQPPLMKVAENHEAACWMLTDYKETAPSGKEV